MTTRTKNAAITMIKTPPTRAVLRSCWSADTNEHYPPQLPRRRAPCELLDRHLVAPRRPTARASHALPALGRSSRATRAHTVASDGQRHGCWQ